MTTILHGDCMDMLPLLPENSIDAVVCDPPYNLASIVKRFGKEGAAPAQHGTDGAFARASKGFMGMKWDNDIAFHPETWIEVYRVMKPGAYLFACCGSTTFDMTGYAIRRAGFIMHPMHGWLYGQGMPKGHKVEDPAWEGWRYSTQATKPAIEPIIMAQKPFSEKTGTANVQRWGTGALNIEACRVAGEPPKACIGTGWGSQDKKNAELGFRPTAYYAGQDGVAYEPSPLGRYPANVIHDGSPEVLETFPDTGDFGSAAQFFYCAKASKADRAGSAHPTVKPLALMRYLCRLITPPGGIVLDPFAGSGTTLQAAVQEGFHR
jgi:site-specific DNA-methyltransferase (adenine-specific)